MFDALQTRCTPLQIPIITDGTDSSCLQNALVLVKRKAKATIRVPKLKPMQSN